MSRRRAKVDVSRLCEGEFYGSIDLHKSATDDGSEQWEICNESLISPVFKTKADAEKVVNAVAAALGITEKAKYDHRAGRR